MVAMGQLTYSDTSVSVQLDSSQAVRAEIYVKNSSATGTMISWRLLSSTLQDLDHPDGAWSLVFCNCVTCYTNEFETIPDSGICVADLLPGDSISWYMSVELNGLLGENAEWRIELMNHNSGKKDTWSYYFLADSLGWPNSSTDLTVHSNVLLYPNPANQHLTVQFTNEKERTEDLMIYNLTGVLVKQVSVNAQNTVQINIDDLPIGIYFVQVNGMEETAIKRFSISR
jgi:hypothetical protein